MMGHPSARTTAARMNHKVRQRPFWCKSLSLIFALFLAEKEHASVEAFLLVVPPSTAAPPPSRPRRAGLYSSSSRSDDDEIGIGIDLGTTYSAVAFLDGDIPQIIPVDEARTMPSVVAFSTDDDDDVLVGRPACSFEVTHGAYRNVKRVLGTGGKIPKDIASVVPFLHPSSDGKTFKKNSLLNQLHDAKEHPTLLTKSNNDNKKKELIRPEEISALVLRKLKDTAEMHTGKTVTRAVIGVPAYFNDAQREATKRAAEMAGIQKVKLLREPEAAALAYGIGKEQVGRLGDVDELVMVFDLGGGTFDCSMLVVGNGLTEIISTSGNVKLGGADFDNRVSQFLYQALRRHGASTQQWSADAKNTVVRVAEQVRIYLSNNRMAFLALPLKEEDWNAMENDAAVLLSKDDSDEPLTEEGRSNTTHVLCALSRSKFEYLCREEFQALLRPLREIAIMSGALLPGDTSPTLVETALELEEESQKAMEFDDFYKEEGEYNDTENSDMLLQLQEASLKEAKRAQQRGRKKARNVAKNEVKYRAEKRKLQEPEGVKVRDGISGRPISRVVLVGGATRMPAVGRLIAALTGVVPQKTVNPDEAVALGCAVHVGILDGLEGMGTVLNPMQAAILRAVAEKEGFLDQVDDDEFDDEEEFDSVEYF